MKVKVWADCGYAGAMRTDELEFDDDMSDDDIEEEVRDWFFEHNSYGWERSSAPQRPCDGADGMEDKR